MVPARRSRNIDRGRADAVCDIRANPDGVFMRRRSRSVRVKRHQLHFRRRHDIEVAHDNFSAAIPREFCGLFSAAGRQACSQGGIAYQARYTVADTGNIPVVKKQSRNAFDNDLRYRIDPCRDRRQAAGCGFKQDEAV